MNTDTKYVTTHHPGRWRRPDGSWDVLAYCRWLDGLANAATGAGDACNWTKGAKA